MLGGDGGVHVHYFLRFFLCLFVRFDHLVYVHISRMYMYVCMYVCMYVFMYLYTVCIHVYMYVQLWPKNLYDVFF